ncbi:DUF4349 domain-containing protein [uncultured Amnibacterium sp.]|uniref:DUF4349 domain-containing protein n=1 Tax=uncultured Amnibacterium sp. TaxID=1631851 RepID=UPI0035C94C95
MRTRVVSSVVIAVIAVAALAGCTAGGGSGGASGTSAAGYVADGGTAASSASGASAKAASADRSIVTTGSLRLVSKDPIAAAGRVTDLVEAAGGRVARSAEDPSGSASARLTLRIPAAAFQRTLDAIEQEGQLRDVSIGATDVTARVTDYGVRIANLRTSIGRLQQLLRTATSSSALVEIEGALTDRQGTLEQLLAQQRTLADQVTYATLTVSIVVPAAAPERGPADFVGGLVTGADSLAATLGGLAIALGVALPWVVVLGALGGVAALVVRAVRRRARPTSA